ncbi:MAG: hypothetical protein M3N02_04175, partial [Pseudomonadota bacterium]|nr:hypothetical protein [Pseudomonadota bacterium]
MTRFLGARGAAAVGVLLLAVLGGSTAAYGQVQARALIAQSFDLRSTQAPIVQAVARTATPIATTLISRAPAMP